MVKIKQRFQMTVAFPYGEESQVYVNLINKLCKRYDCTPNVLVRIALKTLDGINKDDAITGV